MKTKNIKKQILSTPDDLLAEWYGPDYGAGIKKK